jgi:hypothetical protein
MPDARDAEITRLLAELDDVRTALANLAADAASGKYLDWVSSRSEDSALGSGGSGGIAQALMDREKMLLEQLAIITAWDVNVPLAIGHDVTGGDETETNLS